MKILITGAAGFIGSNFINYILEKCKEVDSVLNVDYLSYAANEKNCQKFYQKVKLTL